MNGSGESVFLVSACRSRAIWRSALYGEMKEVRAMVVESANSLATCHQVYQHSVALGCDRASITSAIRLMFSSRSFGEKPRSLFKPKRTLSPSSL